jgi:hypothetical protein
VGQFECLDHAGGDASAVGYVVAGAFRPVADGLCLFLAATGVAARGRAGNEAVLQSAASAARRADELGQVS